MGLTMTKGSGNGDNTRNSVCDICECGHFKECDYG